MRRLSLAAAAAALLLSAPATAAEAPPVPSYDWPFQGVFGTFDRGALQRGFQVYKDVCAACHAMSLLHYRNLAAIGFTEDQVREIAASVEVTDGPDDQGEMFTRPGRPTDRFRAPFPNEQAARAANNGAYPPDLSLMTKARVNGVNYMHALLTGYVDPPEGVQVPEGMYYNAVFPGHMIAMAPPLSPGVVDYPEGIEATVEQMSRDVTTFLAWAAEPRAEERKRTGVKVLLFLFVLTGLLFATKKKIWTEVH